ncbi:ABC transporter substrate-binding protein [Limobrevibacterium gyesilva]|uniref:ABC transporter substrate-binding protein n=1 Tax=Limobrevibacterium gyesilva TaxID=2991712 RepID=A0AA42CET2_9PROT|nr:ABC transporter substrate-binding protein [Limobrevibacterium gyesilva]MCW3476433.1 ABC transporter substrate-binding protein [Limobrevibacterium gyesilva]
MKRRTLMAGAASLGLAGSLGLARPAVGQGARVLRFVPQGNLQNPDPIWTTTVIARNHGYVIWDTLYGLDASLTPRPQMLAGHEISDDRLTWRLTLRDGLRFHDNEPVRATDCVASIARWMRRDGFGQRLAAQMAEMRALDDRRLEIRLTRPFALLPYALGYNTCFIMPERIARTDAFQQIQEYVGSGPYRFVRDEWVSGSRAVYARFDGYVPRDEPASFTSGGKRAHFDRVEWVIMPDSATAAAALQTGEVDWIEQPLADLLPMLRKSPGVVVESVDLLGAVGIIRFNHLQPPFDNVKLRRAILPAVDQQDYMAAVMGGETALSRTGVGVFPIGTPLANDAGLAALTSPRDVALAKRLVAESGYKGERVVLMAPTDFPVVNAIAQVTRSVYESVGLNVEYVSADWGTVVSRRNSKEPVEKGGWSTFCTYGDGLSYSNPASHTTLFGNGTSGWYGWYTSPRMEALRGAWYDAPDLETQRRIARDIQLLVWEEVPYIPVGQWFQPIARRANLGGIVKSILPIFWNVQRA